MERALVFAALLTVAVVTMRIAGAQAPQAPLPGIQKVKDNLYVITGSDP